MNNGNENKCFGCALKETCPDLKALHDDLNGVLNIIMKAHGKGKRISIETGIIIKECKNFSHIFRLNENLN